MPLELFAIAGGVAFVADLIGNLISFKSRFGNAVVSAIVFAAIFAGAMYLTGPLDIQAIGLAAAIFFVVGFIGNLLSFGNRFVNALVTAIVFVALFAGVYYGLTSYGGLNFLR